MESSTYKVAEETKREIDITQTKIRHIYELLRCCGLHCKISGTPPSRFMKLSEYTSLNKDFIKKLLEDDRAKLEAELEVLQQQFKEL
mgnify:CR=1 FL=1